MKEVTLLGQNVNAYRGSIDGGKDGARDSADFALLLEYVAEIPGIERIRYTTSHPKEFTQRLIDAYASIPKLASHLHLPRAVGLRPDARGDEARLHRARVQVHRAPAARRAPRRLDLIGLHRRLPRRNRARFRRDHETRRRHRLRRLLHLSLQPAPGHAGGGARRRHAVAGEAGAPGAIAGADRSAGECDQPGHDRRQPARAGRGPRKKKSRRALRPQRQQPHGEFRRPARAHRPHGGPHHHGGAIAYPTRRMPRSTSSGDEGCVAPESGGARAAVAAGAAGFAR